VWARYDDGIWYKAEVHRKLSRFISSGIETLIEITYDNFGGTTHAVPASILRLVPLVEANAQVVLSRERSGELGMDKDCEDDEQHHFSEEERYPDKQSCSADDRKYSASNLSTSASTLGVLLSEGYVLGDWEKHTKGNSDGQWVILFLSFGV